MLAYMQAVRSTDETIWGSLSTTQRQSVLQTLENRIAFNEGRNARNVVLENMDPGYYGYYNHSDPANIHLSYSGIDDVNDALDTLYHEGRHAYQWDCIEGDSGFPPPILDQFRDGFRNYISPEENFNAYCNNFTEKDACSFAQQQSKLLSLEREAYLEQDRKAGLNPVEVLDESGISAQVADDNVVHQSVTAASYNPAFEQWANKTCSWQPEIEALKTYGGSSTAEKAYTNRDVYEMARSRYEEDQKLANSNWPYLSPEGQKELAGRYSEETKWAQALNNNIGPEKEFGFCVGGFFEASNNVRECCPYEAEQIVPNYSAKKQQTESLESLRQGAVDNAWEREADLVRKGQGTRDWSVAQQAELLDCGKVARFEGSHMMNVKDYPEYAGNPDNIQFLPSTAHFEGVHEGHPRGINPNGRFDEETGQVIPAVDGQIPEQPIIDLTDRYDYSQNNYHRSTPEMEQSGQQRHDDYYQSKENHSEKSQRIGFRAEQEESPSEEVSAKPERDASREESPNSESNNQTLVNHGEAVSANHNDNSLYLKPTNEVDRDAHTSKSVNEDAEAPKEYAAHQPEQGEKQSNFWSSVPSSQTQNDDQARNQEQSEHQSTSREGIDKEPERENAQVNNPSACESRVPDAPKEQAQHKPEQSNEQSGFWGSVPSSSTPSNDQSNSREHSENNAMLM